MAQSQLLPRTARTGLGIRRQTLVQGLVIINLLGMLGEYASGHWDAIAHFHGGVDTFWYPPHFGIYGGLLIAAITAVAASVLALREEGSFAERVRRNAALLFVAGMNALNFTGAPFDAWWHTVYGLDLTIWSPPHLHMLAGMILAPVACGALFMPVRAGWGMMQRLRRSEWIQLGIWIFALLTTGFLFIEYEIPTRLRILQERPDWMYPAILTAATMLALGVIQRASGRIGMATAAATGYVVIRSILSVLFGTFADYPLAYPQPIVVPALLVDLSLLAFQRQTSLRVSFPVVLGIGVLGTLGHILVSPVYAAAIGYPIGIPQVTPWREFALLLMVLGTVSYLLGFLGGAGLRSLSPAVQQHRAVVGE